MNRTVLITGASSGIGKALSKLFAADGYNLVLVARSEDTLRQLAADLQVAYPVQAAVLVKDMSKPSAPDEIFAALQSQGVIVDVLVNSAGYGTHNRFERSNLAEELAMVQVNATSLMHLTRLFLPGMLERGFGRILNVGSTGSFAPTPYMATYGATKAFVLSFSEALSEELKGTDVHVTALCPGVTRTGFQDRAQVNGMVLLRGPVMTADEVARTGYKALMSGKPVVVPGAMNGLMAFSPRLVPRGLTRWVGARLMESGIPPD